MISPTLNRIFATTPPDLLYHYTPLAGLVGIAKSKQLWATGIRYLNDSKELEYAVEMSRGNLINHLRRQDLYSSEEVTLFEKMQEHTYATDRQSYVFSLTEEMDLLSQWRAYCPPSGGYSVGFPSTQLKVMADKQGFYLTPCVYDYERQSRIVNDIVTYHLACFRSLLKANTGEDIENMYRRVVRNFAQDVATYGPVLKHRSFYEEREWRLVSSTLDIGHPKILHRAGRHSTVPYVEFDLVDDVNPTLVDLGNGKGSLTVCVGPTADTQSARSAVEPLVLEQFGQGVFFSGSDSPYRAW